MVEPELLDDGRGPETAPRRLGRRTRAVVGTVGVVALAVAVVVTTTHHPAAGSARRAIAGTPAPDTVQLLDDQYAGSGDRGVVSLELSVINYGASAVDVLRTRLPQAGARPIAAPVGVLASAAPITLVPDRATPLQILARVSCPGVLTAPLADHVDLTLGRAGHADRVASLSIASLGSILDDARHQACGARSASSAIYPSMVPGSVRTLPGVTDGVPVIVSRLQLKNLDTGTTMVSIAGADPSGVTVGVGAPVTLRASQTSVVDVTWHVTNCGQVADVRWPALILSVHVATSSADNTYGFDDTFGTAWRAALREVCSGIT